MMFDSVVYLENVLCDMSPRANVIINLSSYTKYFDSYERRDCLGNHYAINWLDTIKHIYAENTYVVDSIDVRDEGDEIQWIINLKNEKSFPTNALDRICANVVCRRNYN